MGNKHKVVKIEIDTQTMDSKLEATINENINEGWLLVSITPITSGISESGGSSSAAYGWGYGFTSHLLITFRD